MITEMGKRQLSLKYDESQVKIMVSEVIETFSSVFTFRLLCERVKNKANEQDLFNKAPNTNYQEIALDKNATLLIHNFVWKKIWDRELVIDLINDEYESSEKGIKLRKP